MKKTIFKTFTTILDKNIAYHVTDDFKSVDNAREELALKHNFELNNLKYMEQIHSNIVKVVEPQTNLYTCDGLVTNLADTPLLVMVADCIPILFFDEEQKVIAVAHAGRNGTYLDISSNVCKIMIEDFSCNPAHIQVILGPSIQKCCYEVSPELAKIAKVNFGEDIVSGRMIDLQLINKKQLMQNGIKEENITISSICTKCSDEDYFSYRKDAKCGRFGGIIMIRNG